jgi:hypothetical protein
VAVFVACHEAFYPVLKIRGPGGHLGGFITCGGEGAVPGDDQCARPIGMMATEGQCNISAHGMTPETCRFNLQIVQYGDDVGSLPAPPICRLIVRLVALTVPSGVDEDQAIGLHQPPNISGIPPALARPGQAVVEHQRLPAPRDFVMDEQTIVDRIRHGAGSPDERGETGSILSLA